MVWLTDNEKFFEDMFIHFDRIHECDGRMDRHHAAAYELWPKKPQLQWRADWHVSGLDDVCDVKATNRSGVEWLRRHLEPRGISVHSLIFKGLQNCHADATFMPLSQSQQLCYIIKSLM